ncbi:MAG: AAA family ATPase [Planctomycetes bacterium]|nr:AAA family ATPase [Planctomycetota bacterium]
MTTAPYQLKLDGTAVNHCDDRGVPLPRFSTRRADGSVRVESIVRQQPGPRRPIRWLWPGRVPRGQVTLIEGDFGVGKSIVVSDFLARVTGGLAWPMPHSESAGRARDSTITNAKDDSVTPAHAGQTLANGGSGKPAGAQVLLVSRQGDSDVLQGRLQDPGGDVERVVLVTRARSADEETGQSVEIRPLQFPFDIPMLQDELRVQPGIELIVIDPLSDFCDTPQRVSQALRALNELARQTGVAIVVTLPARSRFDARGHLRVTSRYRTEEVRCVWCVAVDPEDQDRRLFVSTRMNACAAPTGLAFTVAGERIDWDLQAGIAAADPLSLDTSIREFLATNLTEQGVPATRVYRLGALQGYTAAQLRAVGKRLGVTISKAPGFGEVGGWLWSLAEAQQIRVPDAPRVRGGETHPDDVPGNSKNRNSLEKPAESETNSVVVALAATCFDVEAAEESPTNEAQPGSDLRSDAAVESTLRDVSAKARTTDEIPVAENLKKRNSLKKAAESGVNSVVVALAATCSDVEAAEESPTNEAQPGPDPRSNTTVESTLPDVSPEARTTDEIPVAENSKKRNSLKKPAESGVNSVAVALAATCFDVEAAEESPTNEAQPGPDPRSNTTVESTLRDVSAEARTTDESTAAERSKSSLNDNRAAVQVVATAAMVACGASAPGRRITAKQIRKRNRKLRRLERRRQQQAQREDVAPR